MTVKGPYLVGHVARSSVSADEFQAYMRDVYEERATRQHLPNDGTSRYDLVWFTDLGSYFDTDGDGVPLGPHMQWGVSLQATCYPKATRNRPASVSTTVTGVYLGARSESMEHYEYEAIGKTMWRTPLAEDPDGYPGVFVAGIGETSGYGGTYGNWGFDGRTFDFARLDYVITPYQAPEYAATASVEIEARPKWEVVSARYLTINTLEICMGTDFGRTDDRWCLEEGSSVGGDALPMLRAGRVYDTLAGVRNRDDGDPDYADGGSYKYCAVAHVPTKDLARVLGGKTCRFAMHVNHVWNVADDDTVPASGDVEVEADGVCAAPVLAAEVDDCSVTIRVSKSNLSGDDGTWPDYTIVSMDGAEFEDDRALVYGSEGRVTFPYVPLNKYTTFEAVGIKLGGDQQYHVSEAAQVGVVVHEHARVVTAVDGPMELKLKYRMAGENRGPSVSSAADSKTEQLAGRELPSVFYTGSRTGSVSFSGILVDEDGTDWERLPTSGLCVVRFPDGRRYAADVSVSVEGTTHGLATVSVSGTEVDF